MTAYAEAYKEKHSEWPGLPADYAYIWDEGSQYRLMVMDVSQDVLLEQIGGEVEVLGNVRDDRVIEALLDRLTAQAELAGRGLTRADVDNLVSSLPRSAEEDEAIIKTWQEREERARVMLQEGRRRSFAVMPITSMPDTPTDALHKQGIVDYSSADWKAIAQAAESYLKTGGDPNDSDEACRQARAEGLSEANLRWLADLFSDPISLSGDSYGNGRHRTSAMRLQGVEQIVVNTHVAENAARRRAALIRSGAPELTPFDQGEPILPSAQEHARPGA